MSDLTCHTFPFISLCLILSTSSSVFLFLSLSLSLPSLTLSLYLSLSPSLSLPLSLFLSLSLSALISRTQSELRSRINEVQEKYDAASIEMEQSVRETIMQEKAAEKIRDTAAMQRKVSSYPHITPSLHIHIAPINCHATHPHVCNITPTPCADIARCPGCPYRGETYSSKRNRGAPVLLHGEGETDL
jgi:hypothetical protein